VYVENPDAVIAESDAPTMVGRSGMSTPDGSETSTRTIEARASAVSSASNSCASVGTNMMV
jgi:hypothetical protein